MKGKLTLFMGIALAAAALSTPVRAQSQGQASWGGTSTGTNTIAVTIANVISYADLLGSPIRFMAGGANTSATTLNVSGLGVKNFYRLTQAGVVPMVGGEIVANQIIEATYDGTEFQLTSLPALNYPVGAIFDYAGAAGCPQGSYLADASTPPTVSLPTLSSILGTTWGSPGGGNFSLPDLNGRTTYSVGGGSGRITVAGGNFDGTMVGHVGGQQNQTLTQAQLPAVAPTFTGTTQTWSTNQTNVDTGIFVTNATTGAGAAAPAATNSTLTVTVTPAGTISNLGSGNAHPVLSNAAIVNKCVKG